MGLSLQSEEKSNETLNVSNIHFLCVSTKGNNRQMNQSVSIYFTWWVNFSINYLLSSNNVGSQCLTEHTTLYTFHGFYPIAKTSILFASQRHNRTAKEREREEKKITILYFLMPWFVMLVWSNKSVIKATSEFFTFEQLLLVCFYDALPCTS